MFKILEAHFWNISRENKWYTGRLKALIPPYAQTMLPCTKQPNLVWVRIILTNYDNKWTCPIPWDTHNGKDFICQASSQVSFQLIYQLGQACMCSYYVDYNPRFNCRFQTPELDFKEKKKPFQTRISGNYILAIATEIKKKEKEVSNRKEIMKKVWVKDTGPYGKDTIYTELLLLGKWSTAGIIHWEVIGHCQTDIWIKCGGFHARCHNSLQGN